jgi:hypothetical protein
MPYTARPTTTGNQAAWAFPQDFRQDHPEAFAGRCDVHVLSPGTFLVTTQVEADEKEVEPDPVVGAFLGFLETQMAARPDLITPLSQADVEGLDELLDGVPDGDNVDWDSFELS